MGLQVTPPGNKDNSEHWGPAAMETAGEEETSDAEDMQEIGEDLQSKLREIESHPGVTTLSDCEVGHEDRKDLERLLQLPRKVEPLKDIKMEINMGGGEVKKTSMREIAEEFKPTEPGQELLNWGSITVPLFEFVKKKFDLSPVDTPDRMEKELCDLHDELIKDGLSSNDVTGLAKRDKKTLETIGREMDKIYLENLEKFGGEVAEEKTLYALDCLNLPGLKDTFVGEPHIWKKIEKLAAFYSKYRFFRSEEAELKVKDALESLNVPGLKIRSVFKEDVWKRLEQLFAKTGLKISNPEKKDEYDILMIYPYGDTIGLICIEVKSGNYYPWEATDLPPN